MELATSFEDPFGRGFLALIHCRFPSGYPWSEQYRVQGIVLAQSAFDSDYVLIVPVVTFYSPSALEAYTKSFSHITIVFTTFALINTQFKSLIRYCSLLFCCSAL
jgi:hypothetical protein